VRLGFATILKWLLPLMTCFVAVAVVVEPSAHAGDGGGRVYRFLPQWIPQAQFAGFYVAERKKFYEKRGLKVEILKGGLESPPAETLTKGGADFVSLFLSDAIKLRSGGLRLVNIGQMGQRSSLMLIARKDSGITKPEDLDGRRVSLWEGDFRTQILTFLQEHGAKATIVPQGSTVNLFLRGGVDAASAMWYNEYHLVLNAGLDTGELTTFPLADHDLNFPEDGIYCLEKLWGESPEDCGKFVAATLEGWRYAFEHPEEALDIVMAICDQAHTGTNRSHQRWMLARMRDIMLPGDGRRLDGLLTKKDYEQVAEFLLKHQVINSSPPFADFAKEPKSHD